MRSERIKKLAALGMFTALSVALVLTIHFPLILTFPFLEYDLGEPIILIASVVFGPIAGIVITVLAAGIQAITVSTLGWWHGFLMHIIATGTTLLVLSNIYKPKKGHSNKRFIIAMITASIAMLFSMIVANWFITPLYLKMLGIEMDMTNYIIYGVLPFNLLKSVLNSALTCILYFSLKKTNVFATLDSR